MQQPQPLTASMGSVPPTNLTAEQIQRYLDENKQLILAILDNQNLGRLNECAQYQAQLQKNLLYLAAIADAQPPSPAMVPQVMPSQGSTVPLQAGNQYMQQQNPTMAPRSPMQFSPQQVQPRMMMQFQGQMGMRPPLSDHKGSWPLDQNLQRMGFFLVGRKQLQIKRKPSVHFVHQCAKFIAFLANFANPNK